MRKRERPDWRAVALRDGQITDEDLCTKCGRPWLFRDGWLWPSVHHWCPWIPEQTPPEPVLSRAQRSELAELLGRVRLDMEEAAAKRSWVHGEVRLHAEKTAKAAWQQVWEWLDSHTDWEGSSDD